MADIRVKNASGQLLAIFDKEITSVDQVSDFNAVKSAVFSESFSGDSTLSFMIPRSNPKIAEVTNLNFIHYNNKKFVIMDRGDVEEVREQGILWLNVKAREAQNLLRKRYITFSNDDYQYPEDLQFIVSQFGTSIGGYTAGSCANALAYALEGSGWNVGTVDVFGFREVATDQQNVYEIVETIAQLWDGFLVWDSLNQTVSIRDKLTWVPYNGYQIRLGKNLKGVTKEYDYNIVTKLYVFGTNDSDITDYNQITTGTAQGGTVNYITLENTENAIDDSFNDGIIYITGGAGEGQNRRIKDYVGSTKRAYVDEQWTTAPDATSTYEIKGRFLLDFTNLQQLRTQIYRNQECCDPGSLITLAMAEHERLKNIRANYKLTQVNLSSLATHSHESYSLGDMIGLIDDELLIAVQIRLIGHSYNIFQPWNGDIELGEVYKELSDILKEIRNKSNRDYKIARTGATLVVADALTSKDFKRADFIIPHGAQNAQTIVNRAIASLPWYEFDGGVSQGVPPTARDFTLAASSIDIDDFYNGYYIKIVSGSGAGQVRKIIDYNGLTKNATVDYNFNPIPDGTSTYVIKSQVGKIQLLEGTYIVNNSVDVPCNVTISGQGKGTIFKYAAQSYGTIGVATDWPVIRNANWGGGDSGIVIENLAIDGNKDNITTVGLPWFWGVALHTSYKCVIKNVSVNNILGGGINILYGKELTITDCYGANNYFAGIEMLYVNGALIKGCHVTKNNRGLNLSSCAKVVISQCISEETIDEAGAELYNCSHCNLVGNIFTKSYGSGVYMRDCQYNLVSGNTFKLNGLHGVHMYSSNHNVLNGNFIMENSQHVHQGFNAMFIINESSYNSIQNNIVRAGALPSKHGLGIVIDSVDCVANIITNNDLYDAAIGQAIWDNGTDTIVTAGNRE
jgi:parallel beta-helix repeat protein